MATLDIKVCIDKYLDPSELMSRLSSYNNPSRNGKKQHSFQHNFLPQHNNPPISHVENIKKISAYDKVTVR